MIRKDHRDIAAFFFGLGMGCLAAAPSREFAIVGIVFVVGGTVMMVATRTSGAGS